MEKGRTRSVHECLQVLHTGGLPKVEGRRARARVNGLVWMQSLKRRTRGTNSCLKNTSAFQERPFNHPVETRTNAAIGFV
eukprot:2764963-Pleurochrysis_carterae.AAC.2